MEDACMGLYVVSLAIHRVLTILFTWRRKPPRINRAWELSRKRQLIGYAIVL